MKLDSKTIAALAERLENCERQAQDTTKITEEHPDMDRDDAYAIQDEIRCRKVTRGHRIIGLKAGLTSLAKMKQMGLTPPVFGFTADYYALLECGECKISDLIHPAGSLILSGGIAEAVSVQVGDAVTLRVQDMGSTSIRFV